FAVKVGGRADQAVALLGFAADQVIPIEDLYGHRFTHVWFCSSDFSRLIIASTRVRACSLRAIKPARSLASCSWLWRRLRFSSLSRRQASTSRSTCALISAMVVTVGSVSDMAGTIHRKTRPAQHRRSPSRVAQD